MRSWSCSSSSLTLLQILIITLGLQSKLITASPSSATPTAYIPSTTVTSADSTITIFSAAPTLDFQAKYHMTTYWSCVTWPNQSVYCGWHEPILDGGSEIIGRAGPCATAKVVAAVGAAVGAVVVAGL